MTAREAELRVDKILIVCPYAAHAGHHWTNAEHLALALQQDGKQVELFVHDKAIQEPAPNIAALITAAPRWWRLVSGTILNRRVRSSASFRMQLETFGTLMAVSQALPKKENNPVLHFIDATFLVFLAWEFFAQQRCVYNLMGSAEPLQRITFLPNPFRWLKRQLTRALLAVALRRGLLEFCAETEAVARDWRKIVGDHVRVIPYAVFPLTTSISQTQARSELGLERAEMILLLFGTQRWDKNFATVITAATKSANRPFLLFVGKHLSGPKPALLAQELGFTNYRTVDHYITESDKELYFAACDVVVLPYNEGYEKGSGVLLEACQYRRPVIATDTGYLAEFVEKYRTGLLFRVGDPEDLAQCVQSIGNLRSEENKKFQRNSALAVDQHSWGRLIGAYTNLYSQLAERTR